MDKNRNLTNREKNKVNYMRDWRTQKEYNTSIAKGADDASTYWKKFVANHKEPIDIIKFQFLGREMNKTPDEIMQETAVDSAVIRQMADLQLWYNYEGEETSKWVEIKVAINYAQRFWLKKSQVDYFEKHYGHGNYLYVIFNKKYNSYAIIDSDTIMKEGRTVEKGPKGLGYKVCYVFSRDEVTWRSL